MHQRTAREQKALETTLEADLCRGDRVDMFHGCSDGGHTEDRCDRGGWVRWRQMIHSGASKGDEGKAYYRTVISCLRSLEYDDNIFYYFIYFIFVLNI